jgi:hypothetical protein
MGSACRFIATSKGCEMIRSVLSLLSIALLSGLTACGSEPPPAAEAPSETAMSSGGESGAPASASSIDEFVDPDRERSRAEASEEAEHAEPAYDEESGEADDEGYEDDEEYGDDEEYEDDEDA